MDEVLVHRIDLLLKHTNEIINDVGNKTFEEFSSSNLLVRATCFSIVQIGEQLRELSKKIRTLYPEVPWDEGIAMRNFVVHEYVRIDVPQVYKTAKEDIPMIKDTFTKIRSELIN